MTSHEAQRGHQPQAAGQPASPPLTPDEQTLAKAVEDAVYRALCAALEPVTARVAALERQGTSR